MSNILRYLSSNEPIINTDWQNMRGVMTTRLCERLVNALVPAISVNRCANNQNRGKGVGKHADIFEGVRMADLKRCIIKPAKEVGRLRIEQEIKILRSLRGGTNIMMLYDIVRDGQVCHLVVL